MQFMLKAGSRVSAARACGLRTWWFRGRIRGGEVRVKKYSKVAPPRQHGCAERHEFDLVDMEAG